MTDLMFMKICGTVAAVGLVTSIVEAVIYFMALPIFDVTATSWLFVYSIVAGAVGVLALILRAIWDSRQ